VDKNKSKSKLDGFPPVLWLNLDRYQDRQKYMVDHLEYWGVEDHTRIVGIDGKEDDPSSYLKGRVPDNMNPGEIGCVLTHLSALKYFVNQTTHNEVIIMEDDIDLSPVKHWTFTWREIRKNLPINTDTCQFTIINPNGIHLKLHHRFINDFSAACYLITRHHAEKVLRCHQRGDLWKIDQNIRPRAVSEDLILDSGKAYALPILNYRLDMGSAIHEEHIDIFHKDSKKGLEEFWSSSGQDIQLQQLMELDEYVGRIPPSVYQQQQT
tara:strand:- start:1839 stop:2636 length:798 start_codon:yes stop_codon:yes gene_type:complete